MAEQSPRTDGDKAFPAGDRADPGLRPERRTSTGPGRSRRRAGHALVAGPVTPGGAAPGAHRQQPLDVSRTLQMGSQSTPFCGFGDAGKQRTWPPLLL